MTTPHSARAAVPDSTSHTPFTKDIPMNTEIALKPDEALALTQHEQVIEEGKAGFIRVGTALAEIQNRRLYRGTHADFESYLSRRWDLAPAYAYRMMTAAKVDSEVGNATFSPNGRIPNERVARAVAKGAPEGERKSLMDEVEASAPKAADGTPKVTAAHVQKVAARRAAPPIPFEEDPEPALSQLNVDQQTPEEWAGFNLEVGKIGSELQSIRNRLGTLLRANKATNVSSNQWAYYMKPALNVTKLDEVIKSLGETVPGVACAEAPGYLKRGVK